MMRVVIYKGERELGAVERKKNGSYRAASYLDPKKPGIWRNFLGFVDACRWVWEESKKWEESE